MTQRNAVETKTSQQIKFDYHILNNSEHEWEDHTVQLAGMIQIPSLWVCDYHRVDEYNMDMLKSLCDHRVTQMKLLKLPASLYLLL